MSSGLGGRAKVKEIGRAKVRVNMVGRKGGKAAKMGKEKDQSDV